jgi:hypothetical protein
MGINQGFDVIFNVIEEAVAAHIANEHRVLSVLTPSARETLAQLQRRLLGRLKSRSVARVLIVLLIDGSCLEFIDSQVIAYHLSAKKTC